MMCTVCLVVALAAYAAAASAPVSKALSGPPTEFPDHEIVDAVTDGVSADSSVFLAEFVNNAWKRSLSVDAAQFGLAVYSPVLSHIKVLLLDPNGQAVDLSAATPVDFPVVDDSSTNDKFTGTFFSVANAIVGDYTLSLSCDSMSPEELAKLLHTTTGQSSQYAMVMLYNDSPDVIYTHVTDSETIVGKSLGLGARMVDPAAHKLNKGVMPPPAMKDVVSDAELEVVFPDGHVETTPMHDDGLHSDGEANDGEFGATFVPKEVGQYVLQALLSGTNANGKFVRTTQHFVQVVPQTALLTGKAFSTLHLLQDRVGLHFEVQTQRVDNEDDEEELKRLSKIPLRIYAEVYGRSRKTGETAVAWVSTVTTVQKVRGKKVLSAEIDLAWFAKAQAEGPISVKNAYIQDMGSMVPLSFEPAVQMFTPPAVRQHISKTVARLLASGYNGDITQVMREGVPPPHLIAAAQANRMAAANASLSSGTGKLIVVHGYCAVKNPFSVYPEDWTDALFFSDPGQGIGIDAFARKVLAFAEEQGVSTFGVVGHSQGGMVALHLMNYYHTGIDAAVGNRKVQSLASPFKGNSAAGLATLMKKLFGLGCKTVNDLTVDGARNWFSGISSSAVAQLNYYTTQYDKGGLFGNGWCNKVMNLFLSNPNDGVTENARAVVNGAINRGLTIGQCHVDGMNWPASYWDHARNAEMNSNAAR